MRTKVKYAWIAFCAVLAMTLMLGGSGSVPSGTWAPTGSMGAVRDNAAAVALPDGRVLIIGGADGSGLPTASAQFYAGGSWSPAASMHIARYGHSATLLADGRVLVVGGETLGGAPTSSVEIYDPATDSWSYANSMSYARSGHTATVDGDGNVVIAGGRGIYGEGLSSVEYYEPASGLFFYGGELSSPRYNHAAARIADGRVLIVGGTDGASALASSDIFDLNNGDAEPGPWMFAARSGLTATSLLDGSIVVIGGSGLNTAEIYSAPNAGFGSFNPAPGVMSVGRTGHVAVRLAHNNSVLVFGGDGGNSAELYQPWNGQFVATGSLGASRQGASSAGSGEGEQLVAGGSGLDSAELYGFATVKTDKEDYLPGETAIVSGSGWTPGEAVTLVYHEDADPPIHPDVVSIVLADAAGNISDGYLLEAHDRGVTYYLSATGQASGHQAMAKFTDAPAADIDQCRNGTATSPQDCVGSRWVNGNAGEQNSHYIEGHSIPYRVRLTEVPLDDPADPDTNPDQIDLYLSYDTKHSDKVAIDHLTHFQCLEPHSQFGHGGAEIVDPTNAFDPDYSVGNGNSFSIPAPTFSGAPPDAPGFSEVPQFNGSLTDCTRTMTIWGGTITEIAYDTPGNPGSPAEGEGTYQDGVNQSTTFIRVRFTPTATDGNVLLAWGGHIASRNDWGFVNGTPRSAGGISGSPYHMRLEDWRYADSNTKVTNLGNQDRSLSAAAIIPTGSIKIVKDAIPDDPQDFSFTGSGQGVDPIFALDDDADGTLSNMKTFTVLSNATYGFQETSIPPGWALTNISCSVTGGFTQNTQTTITIGSDADFDPGDTTVSINLQDGEDVTCTYTNTKAGRIITRKVTQPDPDPTNQSFEFDPSWSQANFSLVNGGSNDSGNLTPGNYSVEEINIPSGWTLLNTVTCDDDDGSNPRGNPANLVLDPGEVITCTFTNEAKARITVVKNTIGGDDTFSYSRSFGANFDITTSGGTGSQNFSNLDPGSYSVTELGPPTGWTFISLVCDDNDNAGGIISGQTATLDLDAGEHITCTYTNRKKARIIVEKQTVGGDGDFVFSGEISATLSDNETADKLVEPGTYQVSELVPSGWDLTSLSCDDSDSTGNVPPTKAPGESGTATFVVAAGETVKCTFTNTKRGKIIIEKQTLPDGSTAEFGFTGEIEATLSDGETDMKEVIPGNYSVTEVVPNGWTLKGIVCNDTDSAVDGQVPEQANFVVAAGEEVKCTWTNIKDPRIRIEPDGTNEVGTEHVFHVFVEQDAGGPVTPISGVTVNVDYLPDSAFPGAINDSCVTDVNGTCDVQINSSSAGIFTAHASAQVTIDSVVFNIETNGLDGNSDDAEKVYVDARINLTPLVAVNAVNDPHTIVATVKINNGSGEANAPNGTVVTFSLVNNNISATFVGGDNDCTTTNGSCQVQITSALAGTVEIHAETDVNVTGGGTTTGGQGMLTLHRETDGTHGSSEDAFKRYINARIRILGTATNEVGDPHNFEIFVEKDLGDGFVGVNGAIVDVTVTPDPDSLDESDCADGTDANGKCVAIITDNQAGVFTATASASVDIDVLDSDPNNGNEVHFNLSTNGNAPNSGPAIKTYVDATILVLGDAVNEVGEQHTFTVRVLANDGGGNDPVQGAFPVVSITPAGFTLVANNCDGVGDTGTNASGECTVVINSTVAAIYEADASVTVNVGSVPLTRDTTGNSGPGGNDGATKKYVDASIKIDPDDTNAVGDPHTFTVTVLADQGSGEQPVQGVVPVISFSPMTPGSVTNNCAAGTDVNGQCTVVINSTVAGTFNIDASVTLQLMDEEVVRDTAGTFGPSGDNGATKVYVDAQIDLTPLQAVNRVGDPHTITATVQQDDGLPAGPPGDAASGFGPAPDGTVVVFSLLNNTAGATFVDDGVDSNGDTVEGNDCVVSGGTGMCSIQITSNTTGGVDIHATTTFSVGGVSLTRASGSGGLNSADAHKDYVNARIRIVGTATNEVNQQHKFNIFVEQDTGSGFVGVNGVVVDVSVTPDPDGGLDETDCANGTQNDGVQDGNCMAFIDSSAAGIFTANASATLNVNRVVFNLSTDGNPPNSGPAIKTYVDARISLSPLEDTNPIGEPHVITVTVEVNPGTGFVAAPDNTLVTFSLQNSGGATASFVGGNTCLTSGGTCTVTINSPTPGTVTLNASVMVSVGGLTLTRDTDPATGSISAGPNGSGPASKVYVAGKIIVNKLCDPAQDPQLFVFAGPGAINEAQLACFTNGNTNQVDSGFLAPGNYNVSEIVPQGWDLTSIVCDDDDNNGGVVASPQVSLVLDANETIHCTFTNQKDANIIVIKQTDPEGDPASFEFDPSWTANFFLSDNGQNDSGDLDPGSYSVSEIVPAGWDLISTQCVSSLGHTESAGNLSLQAGETITCTFTNQKDANIIVVKQTDPEGDPQLFDFTPSYGQPFQLSDNQQNDSGDLNPGTYSVSETVPAGWDLIGSSCVSTQQGDQSTPASISLQAGETVTCTFSNQKDANIIVVKQTDPEGDPQLFDFTPSYGQPFQLSDNQQNDSGDLDPGTYSVSETVPAGWDLISATCSDQSDPSSISLQAGETVTCTFTNQKDAFIIVDKVTIPAEDPQSFSFGGSFSFSLTDQATPFNSGDLAPGSYSVNETVPDGWDLTGTECVSSLGHTESAGNLDLQAGETITCTFTNTKRGKIIVEKVCDPVNAEGLFSFNGPGDIQGADLACGGSEDSGFLVPGPYEVSEDDPTPAFDLTGLVCSDDDEEVISLANRSASLDLDPGETITCTFTNTQRGTIMVNKDVVFGGTGQEQFPFQLTGGDLQDPVNFNLVDLPDPPPFSGTEGQDKKTIANLKPGSYSLAELVSQVPPTDQWLVVGLTCQASDGTTFEIVGGFNNSGPTFQEGDHTVNFVLAPGGMLNCFYSNRLGGKIKVVKAIEGDTSEFFTFTGDLDNGWPVPDQAGGGGNSNTITLNGVDPTNMRLSRWTRAGTGDGDSLYNVTETVAAGFALTNIVCTPSGGESASTIQYGVAGDEGSFDSDFDAGDNTARIQLEGGEIVTCTYTNVELGRIKLNKQVAFGDTDVDFHFDNTGFADCDLAHGESCDTGHTLLPGNYSAQELVALALPAGAWALDNLGQPAIVCTNEGDGTSFLIGGDGDFDAGDDTVNITLGTGGFVECTFINRLGGKIKIVKITDPSPDPTGTMFEYTRADFQRGPTTNFFLQNGGMLLSVWQPVLDAENGTTYHVQEVNLPQGWSLTGLVCDDGQSANPSTVDLATGIATIHLDAGEIVTCTYTNTLEEFEGCTPGFWKNHLRAWPSPYTPNTQIKDVFTVPAGIYTVNNKPLGDNTLLDGLNMKGGSGLNGGVQILMRAAVAALLNAAHPNVQYPRTEAEIIAAVNAALASQNRNTLVSLAGELDEDNNLGCPIGGPGTREGEGPAAPAPEPTTPTVTPTAPEPVSQPAPKAETPTTTIGVMGIGRPAAADVEGVTEAVEQSQIASLKVEDGQAEVSGVVLDETGKPLTGVVGVTFALYSEREGGSPVWLETRNLELDAEGRYTVRIKLPTDLGSLESHWLGVQVQGQAEQERMVLR
ncbi:MAG TPA: kelch repeat-containing protein [Candidatus Xenobia bacterium]|nr:kelch repeat-containing protein [Candidatus Xenobia bacterium]